eukprot:2432496-Amphidinium_carterae.1
MRAAHVTSSSSVCLQGIAVIGRRHRHEPPLFSEVELYWYSQVRLGMVQVHGPMTWTSRSSLKN